MTSPKKAPLAAKHETRLEKHGHVRVDNFFWLKNREDKNVISYLEQENEYTDSVLKPFETTQNLIFNEFKSRVIEDESSVPIERAGYEYSSKFVPG